ncbi:MAG: hypothetical protein IH914_01540, partial [candidate division Zixibacteria bacterium]|nr:hypothetical protein [candidate division Zixibacteria bacterium]
MRRFYHFIVWAVACLALSTITSTRADNLTSTKTTQSQTDKARQFTISDGHSGRYLGSSSAKVIGCVPGSAPDSVRGLTVGCTFHDLQKYGSMGRQIANSPLGGFNLINFSWTNQDNISATGGRNVRYESYDPLVGLLGDKTGGVDIGPSLIPPDRSGFVTLAGVFDGTVIAAYHWNNNFGVPGSRFKPFVAQNRTPGLGDFVNREVDSLISDTICHFGPCSTANYIWPQLAYTEPIAGPKVRHLILSLDQTGLGNANYVRSVADSVWEYTAPIKHLGYFRSPVIAASNQSRRVGIAFSAGRGDQTPLGGSIDRFNGELSGKNDNDIYVMTSEDAGATWTGPLNITLRDIPEAGDWAPHAKLSVLFDSSDVFHVVWQAVQWPDSAFTTRSRMFHWDEATSAVRTAVDANWDPILCDGGENTLNIDNPQLSACGGKLYLTFTQYAPVPLGRGDDCAARAFSGDGAGAANGDIYLTVSSNSGFNWDAPRNLTNTYTPQCDTSSGPPLPDCDSDVWHSVIRYGIDVTGQDFFAVTDLTANIDPSYAGSEFLVAQYINDGDPGAAI